MCIFPRDEVTNKLLTGVYAKVNEHVLSQLKNNGNIKNVGLRVYGIYNTERNMKEAIDIVLAEKTDKQNIGTTATADFTGMFFGFNVEGSRK